MQWTWVQAESHRLPRLCADRLPHHLVPCQVGSKHSTGELESLPQTTSKVWTASLAGFVLGHALLCTKKPHEHHKLMLGL